MSEILCYITVISSSSSCSACAAPMAPSLFFDFLLRFFMTLSFKLPRVEGVRDAASTPELFECPALPSTCLDTAELDSGSEQDSV
mmetsp:Transcript_11206/g.13507  ORF Transcript_11206/g.13507 Transcript_11206/m.13507 type:complete len:85 (-) Transcript_11206:211-465(-)